MLGEDWDPAPQGPLGNSLSLDWDGTLKPLGQCCSHHPWVFPSSRWALGLSEKAESVPEPVGAARKWFSVLAVYR